MILFSYPSGQSFVSYPPSQSITKLVILNAVICLVRNLFSTQGSSLNSTITLIFACFHCIRILVLVMFVCWSQTLFSGKEHVFSFNIYILVKWRALMSGTNACVHYVDDMLNTRSLLYNIVHRYPYSLA